LSRISLLITLAIVAALGAVTVYRTQDALERRALASVDVEVPPPVVEVTTAATRQIRATATVSGNLRPVNEVDVVAEVPGRVTSIGGEIGDRVSEGDVLVRLDGDDMAIAVRQARAAIAVAKAARDAGAKELSASETLFAGNAMSEVAISGVRGRALVQDAQIDQAEAGLAAAQARLNDATVRSPISGVISDRSVGVGRTINPGAPLYHIVDTSTLELEAGLDEAVVAAVSVGTQVDVLHRGAVVPGTIKLISPSLDPRTRKAEVVVSVTPAPGLIANAAVEARVVVGDRMVLAVPSESLLFMDGAAQVVTVVDGKAQRVTVVPGLSDGTWTEVTGVPEGATVIVRGGASVADGVIITPKVVTL